MRGGAVPRAIHDRTTFVIQCNASIKRNGQPATTDTCSLPYTSGFSIRFFARAPVLGGQILSFCIDFNAS